MLSRLLSKLDQQAAVLVTVAATRGSVPRESGAWMAVFEDGILGSIGGGQLELQAITQARMHLAQGLGPSLVQYKLGPALGQCCGGEVKLSYARVAASDRAGLSERLSSQAMPVALFGGGHVGKALVQVLGLLPMELRWIDSRDEIFPAAVPANVLCEHSDPVQAGVADLPPGCRVLIMSFSHAEDLQVVAACLLRQREKADLPFVGLIGSQTKWQTFRRRLLAQGFSAPELDHITCPIGVGGIKGKAPEVIAVAVAAQLLQTREDLYHG